jgi:hypothetical protein
MRTLRPEFFREPRPQEARHVSPFETEKLQLREVRANLFGESRSQEAHVGGPREPGWTGSLPTSSSTSSSSTASNSTKRRNSFTFKYANTTTSDDASATALNKVE